MGKSSALGGTDEVKEREHDLFAVLGEGSPEMGRDDYRPFWLSNTDRYYRSALDLHVHCVGRNWEFCIVLHHFVGVYGVGSPHEIVGRDLVGDGDFFESDRIEGQISVTVGIGEAVEDAQVMHIRVGVPSAITRLQSLENCDSVVVHEPGVGNPAFTSVESLLILPWLSGVPDPLPENWKTDVAPLRFRDEAARQVVETGTNVVEKVGGDETDSRVELSSEVESANVPLAIHPVAHQVGVAIAIGGDFLFEIDEVFFSPLHLKKT